jgi:hypothetical protein
MNSKVDLVASLADPTRLAGLSFRGLATAVKLGIAANLDDVNLVGQLACDLKLTLPQYPESVPISASDLIAHLGDPRQLVHFTPNQLAGALLQILQYGAPPEEVLSQIAAALHGVRSEPTRWDPQADRDTVRQRMIQEFGITLSTASDKVVQFSIPAAHSSIMDLLSAATELLRRKRSGLFIMQRSVDLWTQDVKFTEQTDSVRIFTVEALCVPEGGCVGQKKLKTHGLSSVPKHVLAAAYAAYFIGTDGKNLFKDERFEEPFLVACLEKGIALAAWASGGGLHETRAPQYLPFATGKKYLVGARILENDTPLLRAG